MAIRAFNPVRRVHTVEEVDDDSAAVIERPTSIAARIVELIAGLLLILLGIRFFLALFGANPNNAFANFIYTVSHPFVAPFFNLFKYNYVDSGIGRFEFFTLVAIVVYSLVAALIIRLLNPRT